MVGAIDGLVITFLMTLNAGDQARAGATMSQ